MRSLMALGCLVVVGCSGSDPVDGLDTAAPVQPGDTSVDDTSVDPPVATTSTGSDRYEAILALPGNAAAGAGIYTVECLECHELPGSPPGEYDPLVDSVPEQTDYMLVVVIVLGLGDMDGYATTLTNQEIRDVVAYTRETFGP